jgi:hypothetical protein
VTVSKKEENIMPIDVQAISKQVMRCCDCPELMRHDANALPGYQHGCKLLQNSAFNMIPDETIELKAVFPDCPKLDGTALEGTRYVVYEGKMGE